MLFKNMKSQFLGRKRRKMNWALFELLAWSLISAYLGAVALRCVSPAGAAHHSYLACNVLHRPLEA